MEVIVRHFHTDYSGYTRSGRAFRRFQITDFAHGAGHAAFLEQSDDHGRGRGLVAEVALKNTRISRRRRSSIASFEWETISSG